MVKLSMILFIRGLVPDPAHARIGHLFGAGVLIWGVGSEFSAAFQCRGPKPWHEEGNGCFDLVSLELSEYMMPICLPAIVSVLEPFQCH